MSSAPELAALARQAAGDPATALVTLLRLLCEQLGMSRAVLGRVRGDVHTVHLAVDRSGRTPELEVDRPAAESWCARVPGDRPLVVPEISARTDLAPLEVTRVLGMQCYVGTVVTGVDGRELGVLGVAGTEPHTTLNDRDLDVLQALAEVVGELYPAFLRREAGQVLPAPRRAPDLAGVASVVSRAEGLEELTRPLLEALHSLSGIASTYLTVVHDDAGVQEIRYSRNTKPGFALPEGLEVPWADTLCKRALDEGRSCTTDVPAVWGDSEAARDLGVVTYVSVPVRLADGTVWGTLCGADDVAHDDAASHLATLALFATLIAAEVERQAVLDDARRRAERARLDADTDALTGCASRRAVQPWLDAALAACGPGEVVAVAYVDVDAFKPVNDLHGHAAGDALLVELGRRLRTAAREGDLVARLGGDEFVVAARLPAQAATALLARVRAAGRFALDLPAGPVAVRCATGLATSAHATSTQVTSARGADLLGLADAAMYRDKQLPR